MEMSGWLSFPVVLVILALVITIKGIKTVPQGFAYTVERFGRFTKVLEPGLHFIIPIVDAIGKKVNLMEQLLDIAQQEAITKDNAAVSIDGVVFYQVLDAPMASYEVNNLQYAILNLATTNMRTVTGSMELDELLSNRDEINTRLLSVINAATQEWGVKVTRVEIKDITPPRDILESMHKQMTSERSKRAAILEAEGFREAEIRRAEGEKRSMILEAEGRLEAANKDAEARERLAEAEAKATAVVSKAIAEGDVNAINYFLGQKYIDALNMIGSAQNSKLVLMPLEASGVIGAIGGVAELAKEALGSQQGAGK